MFNGLLWPGEAKKLYTDTWETKRKNAFRVSSCYFLFLLSSTTTLSLLAVARWIQGFKVNTKQFLYVCFKCEYMRCSSWAQQHPSLNHRWWLCLSLPNIRCILSLTDSSRVFVAKGAPWGRAGALEGADGTSSFSSAAPNPVLLSQRATACRTGAQELR